MPISVSDHIHHQTKNTKLLIRAFLVNSITAFVLNAAPPAGNVTLKEIPLNPVNGIASGATRMGGQFSLKGLEHIGLFIGNPNTLSRADRVVMTFDMVSLLRNAAKVKSAKLVFLEEYLFGPDDTREIEVVVFDGSLSELTEESLSSSEVKPVATVTVSSADQRKGGQAQVKTYKVDVTTQLLEKIKAGGLSISFRLQDVKAESEGNPTMEPAGITLDQRPGFLPTIIVQMER
ncbi:hypothetical protein BH09VER1_BH09VER1_47740 [soil metagenome]